MSERAEILLAEMCGQPQISYDRLQAIMRELKSIDDLNDDLYVAIERSLAANEWRCLSLLISIIHWNPDRRFTPILCDLLDNQRANVNLEDIADTLEYLEDERAVPSLVRVLNYQQPGDDGRHFNRKVIYALARVGNKDAVDGLRLALTSQDEVIRQTAATELRRLESSK